MVATRRSLWFPRTALAAGAAVVLVLLSGCSSLDPTTPAAATARERDSRDDSARPRRRPAEARTRWAVDGGGRAGRQPDASGGTAVEQQKVISTGNVQLRSDDVGQAIFDVRKVVDVHRGTISEDDTETDKDGDAFRSRMVLRIPTADFDDAMSRARGGRARWSPPSARART